MFTIIKNTLTTNMLYGHVKLTDDNYIVTINYAGDYQQDYTNHNLQRTLISTICKPKLSTPYFVTFKWYYHDILFEMLNTNILTQNELIEMKNNMTIAIQSKQEFEKIFYELFPKAYLL